MVPTTTRSCGATTGLLMVLLCLAMFPSSVFSQCPTGIRARMSSNQATNPPLVTLCDTGPNPNMVTFICSAVPQTSGVIYRFLRDGVIIAQSSSTIFDVSYNDVLSYNKLARFSCSVISQSGSCEGPPSNAVTVNICTGPSACPTLVTFSASGQCPSFSLRAAVGNPQASVVYTFNLRRSTTPGGAITTVASQTVGPISPVTPDGIFTVFSTGGLPPANAFYFVEVTSSATGCVPRVSNTINLPDCRCPSASANLVPSRPATSSFLSICESPPTMANITFTCETTPTVSGAIYRFLRDGITVQENTSRQLNVSAREFSPFQPVFSYQCQVISPSSKCIGARSTALTIRRCNTTPCPAQVALNLVGSCPSLDLRAVITGNAQLGVAYTFTLKRSTAATGTLPVGEPRTVGPLGTFPSGGIGTNFLVMAQGFYKVEVSAPGCSVISSDYVSHPGCPRRCNPPAQVELSSASNMNHICVGLPTVMRCRPTECLMSDTICLGRFRYQLIRSSAGYLPGPTNLLFQQSNSFTVVPLPGETFNCRVMTLETDCIGERVSFFSPSQSALVCTARSLRKKRSSSIRVLKKQ